ncbi:hypothetical protein [Luteimonas sp. FCS-9]|uniref:hypothetical protein n=1 Tax=Luteimonas sp. FCS-9 TaxID=1547516 RepID=UPI00069A8044|nr:hypothetical protein [Luteimonas sp. FCS-9]
MRFHRTIPLCVALCASLAACQPAADAPAGRPDASAAIGDGAGDVRGEDDVVVSTNEPFWQARVDGDTVVVTGVDAPERRFADVSSSMTADGRRIEARDADGGIVLIVRRMRCEDDMSGARFPMTGLLTIDGKGPYRGCARPASMPVPHPDDAAAQRSPGHGALRDGRAGDPAGSSRG